MAISNSQVASRVAQFGETIFAEITRLSLEHDAVNLGQGFPNFDGPDFVKQAAIDAIDRGENQYARCGGDPVLVEAIARWFRKSGGHAIDPMAEVTVTSGCTEAVPATILGLVEPGSEVIVFEPYYDCYRPAIAMAGATPRFVTLRPPDFRFEPDALRRAFTSKTRAIIVNTPHNPTGRVFDEGELTLIAELCREHDVLAITDEVYERLVFDGRHIPLATLDGMAERTITLSSLGKTFSLTGWKIGWAIAPPPLTAGVRAAHQFMTYSTATPLQHGAAAALAADDAYFETFRADYRRRRDLLVAGLQEIGFVVDPPQGTYFVLADHTPFGFGDDVAFVRHLISEVGVAAIPPSAFYDDPEGGKSHVRFAFCKDDATLEHALERMRTRLRRG